MMQSFRNAAKPVIYLLTITFLAWMIVDLSGITGSGGIFTKTSVGSINGQSIEIRAYQEAVQQAIQQQQAGRDRPLGLDETQRIRDDVWEQFIRTTALEDEYARRHLTTNTAEIAEAIRYNPPPQLQGNPSFMSQGQFDFDKYHAWLASSEATQVMPYLQAEYRDQILRSKLYRTVVADVVLSDAALWDLYRYKTEAVRVSLTSIVPRAVAPDSVVPVSKEEVDAYYKAHPESFRRARVAFLSYVSVASKLDASDSAAALARATEVRNEIKSGAPFEEIARRESTDRASATNGGALGTFGKGTMNDAFEKAAFALPLNALSEPVLSPNGYHLIEVTSRTKDSVTARHILIPIGLAGAHRDLVDAQTDSLEQIASNRLDGTVLDTAAKTLHLPVGVALPVTEGTAVAVGDFVFPDAGVWAFRAKVSETSHMVEGEDAFYVFRLDSIQAAGIPPIDAIRASVETIVRDEKKAEVALAIGQDLVRRIQSGTSLADASKALNLPNREFGPFVRNNPPVPNAILVGAMFGVEQGKTSGLVSTPQGQFVFKVLERNKSDSVAFRSGIDKFRAEAVGTLRQDRIREFEKSLRAAAKVKDERAAIYNTTDAQNAEITAAQKKAAGSGS